MLIRFSPSHIFAWADTPPANDAEQNILQRAARQLCRVILITVQEFKKNELSLRAAALTFTVMLSLVPLLAMSSAVVKGLGGSDQLKEVVYSYVETLEQQSQGFSIAGEKQPTEESSSTLTQHLYSAIDNIFSYVEQTNFATLGTFGVAGIFISAILVLGNIEMAMNAIWHVRSGRSVMRKVADYLALLVLMPISINVGIAAGAVLKNEALLSKISIFLPFAWMQALILKLIPVLFLTLTLYVIYLFFPNTRVKNLPAMVGALFAGFFWFQIQNIYIGLQVGVAKNNAIYGSFATLPLFLVWLYFGWIFILLGAQLAYAYQHKDSIRLVAVDFPPSLRLAVAFDLLDFVEECFQEQKQATLDGFTEKYRMHSLAVINETIVKLENDGLLHRIEGDGSLMPSMPRKKIEYSTVVQAIIGSIYSESEGGKKSSCVLNAVTDKLSFSAEDISRNR